MGLTSRNQPLEPALTPAQAMTEAYVRAAAPGHRVYASDGWELLRRIWRRKFLVLTAAGIGLLLGIVAAASLPTRYQAETRVLLGVQEPKVTNIQSLIEGVIPNDESVRSEAYVIASRDTAREVGYRLALDQSAYFNPALAPPPGWSDRLSPAYLAATVGDLLRDLATGRDTGRDGDGSEPATAPPPDLQAQQERLWQNIESRLLYGIVAEPLNRSHVLSIVAELEDPVLAASVANAFADVYVEQQLVNRRKIANQANEWLDTRIQDLRAKVIESERAVEAYRRQNELFASRSDTMVGQQLAVLNQELMTADSERASAKSRLDQAQSAGLAKGGIENIPTVLQSPLIVQLRGKQADLERQAADLSATYTSEHPRMRNIGAQIDDIGKKIAAEIRRIVASLRNEYQISADRFDRVVGRMDDLKSRLGQVNSEEVTLRQLEREADASRTLLENLLQRSKETAEPPEFAGSNAEIISPAVVPNGPSFPPNGLIVLVATMAGVGIGVVLALLVERMDQTFRTPDEVEEYTGLPTLAVLPQIRQRRPGRVDHVLRNPYSTYTNALRKLCAQLSFDDIKGRVPQLIMIASALPGEGKSHSSCSLAQLLAGDGRKVILLDLDWRQPTQHRNFGQRRRGAGIVELLRGEIALEDVIHTDEKSGVDVLFAGVPDKIHNPSVSLQRLHDLLRGLTRHYDHIVLDTSPLMITPELLYLAQIAHRVILTVKWGSTPRGAVTGELRNLLRSGARVAGIVLTQVNPDRYSQYSYNDGGYLRHGYLVHDSR